MENLSNFHMIATLVILFIMICCFASGKIRTDVTAVGGLLGLLLTNTLTPNEALTGFSSPVVAMMASVFIVGGAIVRTGLAHQISRKILGFAGTNQYLLFVLIMLVTAAIGSIVSNTGTVAIMMPIVVSLANSIKVSPSRFLMPLAFMSSMGGMLTLIGNTPNMVVGEILVDKGYPALTLFSFLPIGLICITFGLLILTPATSIYLSRRKTETTSKTKSLSLKELVAKYHINKNLYVLRVPESSTILNETLADLSLTTKFNLSVIEIRRTRSRKTTFGHSQVVRQIDPGPKTKIFKGDILHVSGTLSSVHDFAEAYGLSFQGSAEITQTGMRFDYLGVCELVVLSTSRYVGRKVEEAGLRKEHGITLLGIQRKDEYILENLKEQTIQAGDALLVQGSWETIGHLQNNPTEWIVMGRPLDQATANTLQKKIPYVILILIGMIISMTTGLFPTVTSVMVAALLMVSIGSFKNTDEAYSFINWESIILIACMLPLSLALQKTGIIDIVAQHLGGMVQGTSPYVALAIIYATASLLNMVISTTATTLLIAPIAVTIALSLGLSPYPFIFSIATASGACFSSPFSTPANALVMSAGRYSFMDYVKIGLPMQLLLGIIMIFALPAIFPF